MNIFSIFLIIALLILIGISFYFNRKVVKPKCLTYDEILLRERERGNLEEEYFESLMKEYFEIINDRNEMLCGYLIYSDNSTDLLVNEKSLADNQNRAQRIIIFSHGITNNMMGSLKYVQMFLDRGFCAIIYDHKNHGKSCGSYTSFGVEEKYDLSRIIDYAKTKCIDNCVIGVHGESMGAATALQHAAIDSRVAFVISDCSFDEAFNEFSYRLKVEHGLPSFPIVNIASFMNKLIYGISFRDMSPLKAVQATDVPTLFIHGKNDSYVPFEQTTRLYESKVGVKNLYLAEDARHAFSYSVNKDRYREEVYSFLEQIKI